MDIQTLLMIVTGVALLFLVLVFIYLMYDMVKRNNFLVNKGFEDRRLVKENIQKKKPWHTAGRIISSILSWTLTVGLVAVIGLVVYGSFFSNNYPIPGVGTVVAVATNSMGTQNENNKYLNEHKAELGNLKSFYTNDLIKLHELPPQDQIQHGHIYSYVNKETGKLVIHRLVDYTIDTAPEDTLYRFQGDGNAIMDKQIVTYADMRGEYKGGRIAGLGGVVLFFQSPIGITTSVLSAVLLVGGDIGVSRIDKQEKSRYNLIKDDTFYKNVVTEEENKSQKKKK